MSDCCNNTGSTCCRFPLGERPPAESELAAAGQLPAGELIARYRWGVEHFDARLFHLTPDTLDQRFDPDHGMGLWSCRELVGHLADAEIAYVHRIRQTIAEESPMFANWDEHAYVDSNIYARTKPGGYVASIYTLRVWTGELLETLDDAHWMRKGMHPLRGEFTLRSLVEFATWHLERHAWFLNRKIEAIAGPLPESAACDDTSTCACKAEATAESSPEHS